MNNNSTNDLLHLKENIFISCKEFTLLLKKINKKYGDSWNN
jgi:hypothetical protein